MNINAEQLNIFTQHEQLQMDIAFASIKKAARWNPLYGVWIGLITALQLIVFYSEYELAYQIFSFISGDDGYWNAHIMAMTGMLFIIGFHVMAYHKPNNRAVQIVTALSVFMLPIYALGLGFLVMAILYGDGLADVIATAQAFTLTIAQAAIPKGWLELFFEYLANPISVLIFALATGGLAVVNLYISHHLISRITTGVTTLYQRHVRLKDAKSDYAIIQNNQRQFQEIAKERSTLATLSPHDIASEIAAEVMVTIQNGLAPHKQVLKRCDYEGAPPRFLPTGAVPDPKQLSKDIATLDQINTDDLLQAMNISHTTTEEF